jgi:endonuclease/exonuclease/phosphatase family metal-dependent hydrolase
MNTPTYGRAIGLNFWDDRQLGIRIPLLAALLTRYEGSIICGQELGSNEYPQIFNAVGKALDEPAWEDITTRSPNTGAYGMFKAGNRAVFWRPSKWKHLAHASINLQPDDRQVPMVLLESLTTGERVAAGSLHLSHTAAKAAARLRQIGQFISWSDDVLNGWGDPPALVLGDINSTGTVKDPGDVRLAMRKGGWRDLIQITGRADPTHGDRRLDEGFTRNGMDVRAVTTFSGGKATDHAGQLVQFTAAVKPAKPVYLGPFQLLTDVWAIQHNPQKDPRKPKDGTRKPYGKLGYRPKGYRLANVVRLIQAKDSAGKEHTYALTATGNRYAMGDSPNKRNWIRDLSK